MKRFFFSTTKDTKGTKSSVDVMFAFHFVMESSLLFDGFFCQFPARCARPELHSGLPVRFLNVVACDVYALLDFQLGLDVAIE
ncbi:hypothetical protein [uncultured Gimesia sp.]|uniref:hypothetical protein n=1 Tax=uncultured Gimesia sp. TaxID=1678688 RepID=UPI00260A130A|nr:hypothetical protein [uncultured Gimesia sp.]